ncbi:hypothetical protein [Brassicibacter mesophilus]|uniref:hypothetical protein n=1 Tax=Brassicibacter mesophilus TaxID=745119 RepID=UPI003D20908E
MKKFIEKVKDFLYDAIDFVLIFVIIVAVAGIIGWRLDILFAKDMDKPPVEHITDNNSNNENKDEESNDSESKDDEDLKANEDTEDNKDNQDNKADLQNNDATSETDTPDEQDNSSDDAQDVAADEVVTVKIPNGSLPPTIANILLEKGLIDNKMDFLKKSQELKLDTKLKSGEFEIKRNSSLETIIKALAK